MHIHTIMSGHAFCTINECIEVAQRQKLSLIAITDHGPSMQHSAHEGYFEMSERVPKSFANLRVLFGCEVNILSKNGDVDLSTQTMSKLDVVLAGLHARTPYIGSSEADNTSAIINTMKRHPSIRIITHPYRADFPVYVPDVVYAAKEYNVLLEINASLLLKAIQNRTNEKASRVIHKTAEIIRLLQSTATGYVINSDAHHSSEIGISSASFDILSAELGIRSEFILNNRNELLSKFIPAIKKNGSAL